MRPGANPGGAYDRFVFEFEGLLSSLDVREATFGKPPIGKRGYNKEQVDELLEQIADRLESRNALSADDVRHARFGLPPILRRGYNEDQVDVFLDRAVASIEALQQRGR